MLVKNIFSKADLPSGSGEEFFESLCEHKNLKIERIISQGQVSPPGFWYTQQNHEWVVLVEGKATLELEDGKMIHLRAGDSLMLPAGLKHRVTYTSKDPSCTWIAVHFK